MAVVLYELESKNIFEMGPRVYGSQLILYYISCYNSLQVRQTLNMGFYCAELVG